MSVSFAPLIKKEGNIRTTPDPGYHGKATTSQLDVTNESQEVSPFPAGDHKASTNGRTRKQNKKKTEITQMIHKRSTTLARSVKLFCWGA